MQQIHHMHLSFLSVKVYVAAAPPGIKNLWNHSVPNWGLLARHESCGNKPNTRNKHRMKPHIWLLLHSRKIHMYFLKAGQVRVFIERTWRLCVGLRFSSIQSIIRNKEFSFCSSLVKQSKPTDETDWTVWNIFKVVCHMCWKMPFWRMWERKWETILGFVPSIGSAPKLLGIYSGLRLILHPSLVEICSLVSV